MTARKVYIVENPSADQRIPGNGPTYVHGDEDLKRRQDAAKEAGVRLTVRPAP